MGLLALFSAARVIGDRNLLLFEQARTVTSTGVWFGF
jgi:hypothetical protein